MKDDDIIVYTVKCITMYLEPIVTVRCSISATMKATYKQAGTRRRSPQISVIHGNVTISLAKLAQVFECGLPSSGRQLEQCFFQKHCTHQRSCFERTLMHMPTCCCLCSARQPVGSDTSQLSQTQFSSVSRVTCKALLGLLTLSGKPSMRSSDPALSHNIMHDGLQCSVGLT